MNRDQLEALDKMIGETLAKAPTRKQNEDHLRRIEEDVRAELDADREAGVGMTVDEETVALRALHQKIYPNA